MSVPIKWACLFALQTRFAPADFGEWTFEMKNENLALSLIRAPWSVRLQDRTFLAAIFVSVAAILLFRDGAIDGNYCLTTIAGVWGLWSAGNQIKDAAIGAPAVAAASSPQTVNAGTAIIRENDAEKADREGDNWGEFAQSESAARAQFLEQSKRDDEAIEEFVLPPIENEVAR